MESWRPDESNDDEEHESAYELLQRGQALLQRADHLQPVQQGDHAVGGVVVAEHQHGLDVVRPAAQPAVHCHAHTDRHQQLEQRCLAGSRPPGDEHQLAGLDRKTDVAQRLVSAGIALRDVAEGDHRCEDRGSRIE